MDNEKNSKIFLNFLLRLALIVRLTVESTTTHQVSTTAVQLVNSRYDELDLNSRLSALEAKHKHQDDEISLLKALRVEDNKIINHLRDRVDQLEASVVKTNGNERILERQKRPFRLAPLTIHREKENKFDDEQNLDRNFYGPATSCEELGMLGYTLNGFYMVQGKSRSSGSRNKIEVVYCRFFQPFNRETKEATENRLGFLNIMDKTFVSGEVYFYVQRYGSLSIAPNGIIRFNKVRLNMGGAMNVSTGVFTVPKAGIYHFSVTIAKEGYSLDALWVYFRINGNKIGMSAVGATVTGAPATLHPILKLKKGDRVDLWKDNSFGTLDYLSGEPTHHFSGWLMAEEDLE